MLREIAVYLYAAWLMFLEWWDYKPDPIREFQDDIDAEWRRTTSG